MGLIRISFKYLSQENFKKLYVALVRPHLEFCNIIWSPIRKKDKLFGKCTKTSNKDDLRNEELIWREIKSASAAYTSIQEIERWYDWDIN